MSRCSDQKIGHSGSVRVTDIDDGRNDLTVAARGCNVERQRLKGRLDLLETGLTTSALTAGGGKMGPGGQFGSRDRADRGLVWQPGCHLRVVPIDDHRGVEQAGGHSQTLIGDAVQVRPELDWIDVRSNCRQSLKFGLRDKASAGRRNGPQLGYRDPAAGHDEGLASHNRVNQLRVGIAQLALGHSSSHEYIVA